MDYTLIFPDTDTFNNPGLYPIIVKGRGNYDGERELQLRILEQEKKLVNTLWVPAIPNQEFVYRDVDPKDSGKDMCIMRTMM